MSVIDGVKHRMSVLLRREQYAAEQERELRTHLAFDTAVGVRAGLDSREAEDAARRRLGNLTYYREETRRMSWIRFVDAVKQDATYAQRSLRRAPGFAAAVVLMMGVGIGVTAGMFSFLDPLLWDSPRGVTVPVTVRRLYVEKADPQSASRREVQTSLIYPEFASIAPPNNSTPVAASTAPESVAVSGPTGSITARRSYVTAGYFELLGIRPLRGRFFDAGESVIWTPAMVAVVSQGFWQRQYGADAAIVGRMIRIDSRPYTIIGVTAGQFAGIDADAVDIWVPANSYPAKLGASGEPWYETFNIRLRPVVRVTNETSERDLISRATRGIRSVHVAGFLTDSTATILTGPLSAMRGPHAPPQEVQVSTRVAGVACLMLLISAANVANLLLARSTRRRREFAMRRALGVSRARLFQQILLETTFLMGVATGIALVIALWTGTVVRRLMLPGVHIGSSVVGSRTIMFVIVIALVGAVILALLAAVRATRDDEFSIIRTGMRGGTYRWSRVRDGLVTLQAALSVILVIGAGLFIQSLRNVQRIDLGFNMDRSLTMQPVFVAGQDRGAEVARAIPVIAERLMRAPGVEKVAFGQAGPMAGASLYAVYRPGANAQPVATPSSVAVSPGYFAATGMRLIEGRDFGPGDRPDRSVVVSRSLAQLVWPGKSAVGECLVLEMSGNPCAAVIGVVNDVHRSRIIETTSPQLYRPVDLNDVSLRGPRQLVVLARAGAVMTVTRLAMQEFQRELGDVGALSSRTLSEAMARQLRPWRLGATLFTAFGALAVLVAAFGVYSVVSYTVSQRMHEMGVRVALGGSLRNTAGIVVRGVSFPLGIGILGGLVLAFAGGSLLQSLLYGISAKDPRMFAFAAAAIACAGMIATLGPALRAAKADPIAVLRIQ
jgi:putative ABC transport system permease protein